MRTSALLGILVLFSTVRADDVLIADFENNHYHDWESTGTAFGERPANGSLPGQQDVMGFRGNGLVNTFLDGDGPQGTLTSPEFEVTHKHLVFLIGGGSDGVGVQLLRDGSPVRSASGKNREMLSWHSWNVAELKGKSVQLRIFDHSSGGFGHINVDHILATDSPRSGPGILRLSDYRKTDEYYNEPYRPQFHFTPEMNWMNDPNGLVYFEGEYHLFYQHNPHGNSWGHMSWGHAVSKDMVNWKHLPIALHEEYGVMIFSGCCVVDWQNTSGFGRDGKPPLVAVYTGHGWGKQTQDIAYSNDRGRTWTKYNGNPVIDKNEADFRDPKVFWHAPTQKWIMVVSMATAKYVQFYSSDDLKNWKHLSDFGPAGVKDKPNWECPDLFELPIENEPGKTRWVLEVDMGNGSVAGGSGGEYFVGAFDGRQFTCDHDLTESQWVDYGRDFYAPVSWSDIPESDGRRIWLGWMNNWETNLLPTRPWRSAMSIPRSLSLRRIDDRLVMVQRPVKELESLRATHQQIKGLEISSNRKSLVDYGIQGDKLEIIVDFRIGAATEIGLSVGENGDQHTLIGYDVEKSELFVDRTKSGNTGFHTAFTGRHSAPLRSNNGKLSLHVFVDTSSVEVFANDGEIVITERIFPQPESKGISVYAKNGKSTVDSIDAWTLKSVWADD